MELKHQTLFLQESIIQKIKICETECKKNMPLVKQNVMKLEVFILGKQRRERRDGGEGEERGLRKGAERREKRQKRAELTIGRGG